MRLTPEQEAQLTQIAGKEEARFLAGVEKGIAAAERGEFVEEEEMDAWLETMFSRTRP